MAPVFAPDIIARVKDETDIVEVVRRHVNLKAAGSVYKGLCPFHKEKTPSFIVTPARGRYHCFGCGAGGDVISFMMEIEGVSFVEAVEILARALDIDLSDYLRDEEGEGERRAFHRANGVAADIWKEALWDASAGRKAREYLLGRGFAEQVLRDFSVGWAPASSAWFMRRLAEAGVDRELALRADLLREGRGGDPFAYFRGRVIFPIRTISRQVVGFGGRILDEGEPKYLNSADSPYFTKGDLLYGYDYSRMPVAREKTAILVEGYLDLLALVQVGFTNVVATCGTAFTPGQARLIRRGAPTVHLLFDGDKAGGKAAVRSADIALRAGLEPRIVSLPKGKDPADMVMEQGAESIAEALASARGYVPYLRDMVEGRDRSDKERAVKRVLETVAGMSDLLRREYILQETADAFGLELGLLKSMVGAPPQTPQQGAGAGAAQAEAPPLRMRSGRETAPPAPDRARRPRVRRMSRLNRDRIEADLFLHILLDPLGGAARAFGAEREGVVFSGPAAETLATEIETWLGEQEAGRSGSLQDFVLARWNMVGDQSYRAFVSRLLDMPDRPAGTDYERVTRDCLARLRREASSSTTHSAGVGPEHG